MILILTGALLSPLFAILGSTLTLSLVAVGTRGTLWLKMNRTSKVKDASKSSYILSQKCITPLYVQRITHARMRKAQRTKLPEVCANRSLTEDDNSNIDSPSKSGLWKEKGENCCERRTEKQQKRPRIDAEKLNRINREWRLVYGSESQDLFHVENELDKVVSKVSCVHAKKRKSITFNKSVRVVYIERKNSGRRMSKWKPRINVPKSIIHELTSNEDFIV